MKWLMMKVCATATLAMGVWACGGNVVADGAMGSDGGFDATAASDAKPSDEGRPDDTGLTVTADANADVSVTRGRVTCGGSECDLGSNSICCEPPPRRDAGPPYCGTTCPNEWGGVSCGRSSDCSSGLFCCGAPTLNGATRASCMTGPCNSSTLSLLQYCETASECASGVCAAGGCVGIRKYCGGSQLPSWCAH